MRSLSYQNDDITIVLIAQIDLGNIILIAQIVNLQSKGKVSENLFFAFPEN